MIFEWDERKNAANIAKHGVSFTTGARIFDDFVVTSVDSRRDYQEMREISIGRIEQVIFLTVVHTDRIGRRRIISVRQANRKERRHYDQALQSRADP